VVGVEQMKPRNRVRALKTKEHREWLTQSVRTHLVPALTKQGFEVTPLVHGTPSDREFDLSFPEWGRLIRVREPGVDLVEIQLATHRRAAFRINAGVAPRGGLMTLRGHRPAEEVAVHWLNEYFETHARPWLRPGLRAMGLEPLGAWFSLWHWPYRSPTRSDYDRLALRVAGFLPEVELALREGKLGPHMRRIVIPKRVPQQGAGA
jgi:hypothetical protein